MNKKLYWLAPIALAAVWIYAVSQSAGGLLRLLPGREQPGASVEAPREPLSTPLATQGAAALLSESINVPAAERPPTPAVLAPAAPPIAERAPTVYADDESAIRGSEPLDHPEVTDPHLRKLLQPAWDD